MNIESPLAGRNSEDIKQRHYQELLNKIQDSTDPEEYEVGLEADHLAGKITTEQRFALMSAIIKRNSLTKDHLAQTGNELTAASTMDRLTEVFNRSYFDRQLSETLLNFLKIKDKEAHRFADAGYVCIFFLDLNHFKFLNDTKGHLAGDNALKIVASCLKSEAQERGGQAFRYGGDEFVLMQKGKDDLSMEQTELAVARIEQRIDKALAEAFPDLEYKITVSVGSSIRSKSQINLDSVNDPNDISKYASSLAGLMVAEADTGMYEHKDAKKGEVVNTE